jgi:hypothetical protein
MPLTKPAARSWRNRQRRCRFVGKARGGIFRVADGDLLKILDAPEVAVLANRAQVEARHAERLGPHLGVPAVEAPEVEIGGAVGQPARLDRVVIVDQEQEDIAVRGIERGRVAADLDIGDCRPRSTSRARPAPSSACRRCHCPRCAAPPRPVHGRRCGHSRGRSRRAVRAGRLRSRRS